MESAHDAGLARRPCACSRFQRGHCYDSGAMPQCIITVRLCCTVAVREDTEVCRPDWGRSRQRKGIRPREPHRGGSVEGHGGHPSTEVALPPLILIREQVDPHHVVVGFRLRLEQPHAVVVALRA